MAWINLITSPASMMAKTYVIGDQFLTQHMSLRQTKVNVKQRGAGRHPSIALTTSASELSAQTP